LVVNGAEAAVAAVVNGAAVVEASVVVVAEHRVVEAVAALVVGLVGEDGEGLAAEVAVEA